MSVYVDANSHLHHDQERSLALNCPHCQVYSHITAVSVPQYSELVAARPGTPLITLDGVGHYPMVEAADRFSVAVLDLLDHRLA